MRDRLQTNAYMRKYNKRRMEIIRNDPELLAKHRAKMAAKARKRRARRREEFNRMSREYNAGYRKEHPDKVLKWKAREKQRSKEKQRRLKRKMLDLYGHVCQCCGESTFEFLGIDHINGGGQKERKRVGGN